MSPREGAMAVAGVPARNEVVIAGRLSQQASTRTLPSGDRLCTFRVVVDRPPSEQGPHRRVDALECVTWSGRVRRSASTWLPGDVVQVEGAVRRRFFRSAGGVASRVEIEVRAGRLIRRATSA